MTAEGDTSHSEPLELEALVERKAPALPRFVVVPAERLARWSLAGTTVVEGRLGTTDLGRRTVKRWDPERWFLELPAALCRRAGVETGDRVRLILRRAPTEPPPELARLLEEDPVAREAWEGLTRSRQRMLREHVASAAKPETRERRARKALCRPPDARRTR